MLTGVEVGVDQTIDQPVEAGRDRVETEEVLLDATYASLEVGPQDPAAGSPPERFAPGRLLLDRYRIVTKLGQGGMGEVYRADDLVLDQPVALKFLPEGGDAIGARLDQLRAEVRLARQISHPNICAVYDIGEAENTPFISMEFIDGEDLQALLTRVGRLTTQQGLDLAKQMAVGIHAAHQKGSIHRDLKPANIMVDSQGQVRITDFGLAQLTVDAGAGQLAGTPAYMAPEQLRGGEVSVQSDLYALGLILYEMFAGQAVHDVRSLSDAVRMRSRDTAVSLSSFNADLDSAVEQAIEGCLRHDPAIRVKSALTVFQSLPGNSPLEAALAMGYTPSPEQVAASVEQPLLNTKIIVTLLLTGVGSLVFNLALSEPGSLLTGAHFGKSPDTMRTEARAWLDQIEIPRLTHTSAGLRGNQRASDYEPAKEHQRVAWRQRAAWRDEKRKYHRSEHPAAAWFWYRESETSLRPREYLHVFAPMGVFKNHLPSWDDPAITGPDSLLLVRTPAGKLDTFRINLADRVLPRWKSDSKSQGEWIAELFREAGLRRSDFVDRGDRTGLLPPRGERAWVCPVAHDACLEWVGKYPQNPHLPISVRIGFLRGRLVYFRVVPPWREDRQALVDLPATNLKLLRWSVGYWAWQVQPRSYLAWNWDGFITGPLAAPQATPKLRAYAEGVADYQRLIAAERYLQCRSQLEKPPKLQRVEERLASLRAGFRWENLPPREFAETRARQQPWHTTVPDLDLDRLRQLAQSVVPVNDPAR